MKTFTIRDFRSKPRAVQTELRNVSEAVLTSNGRPVALLVPVDAGSLDGQLDALRNARAVQALHGLREDAKAAGVDSLSGEGVDDLIRKSRRSRRAQAGE